MGGNFATATPDTEATHRALRNCDLTVHVATKLNRSHLVHGREALILPCLGRTEIDVQETGPQRSEEHTSELQSLMRISYAVFCLKKKNKINNKQRENEASHKHTIRQSKK